jgi:hypothetical protein
MHHFDADAGASLFQKKVTPPKWAFGTRARSAVLRRRHEPTHFGDASPHPRP